jgi:hypothetical protein
MQFTRHSQALFPLSFRRKLNHRGHRGGTLTVENQRLTETSTGVTKPSRVQACASRVQTSPSRVQACASRVQTSPSRVQAWTSRAQTWTPWGQAFTTRRRASGAPGRAFAAREEALHGCSQALTTRARALGARVRALRTRRRTFADGRCVFPARHRARVITRLAFRAQLKTRRNQFRPFRATKLFGDIQPWAMPTAIESHACSVMAGTIPVNGDPVDFQLWIRLLNLTPSA